MPLSTDRTVWPATDVPDLRKEPSAGVGGVHVDAGLKSAAAVPANRHSCSWRSAPVSGTPARAGRACNSGQHAAPIPRSAAERPGERTFACRNSLHHLIRHRGAVKKRTRPGKGPPPGTRARRSPIALESVIGSLERTASALLAPPNPRSPAWDPTAAVPCPRALGSFRGRSAATAVVAVPLKPDVADADSRQELERRAENPEARPKDRYRDHLAFDPRRKGFLERRLDLPVAHRQIGGRLVEQKRDHLPGQLAKLFGFGGTIT